jgi:ATP-binding cassette subfamily F protein 3
MSAVLTDAPFEPTPPRRFGVDELCAHCRVCEDACPPEAIGPRKQLFRGEWKWYVDFNGCLPFSNQSHGCAICVAVCPWSLPNPMLAISGADFGYVVDGVPRVIVGGVSRSVLGGQRIGILGANGQGKSAFVKTIARDLAALGGEITEGRGLSIGYFAQQELDVLSASDTPLVHMVRLARERGAGVREATGEQALRAFLGSFNFGADMIRHPVGTLSGGEKARLVLAMMVWQRPNLLLLDEPTNHLDLVTREALAMALNRFEGMLMLVSHDSALLRSVCDEFWLIGRGRLEPFGGDLDDDQRYLLEESRRLREEARAGAARMG